MKYRPMNNAFKNNIITWTTETALMLSLYIILSVISRYVSLGLWPSGGKIGVQFIVVIITFYRLGTISPIIVVFIGTIIYSALTGFIIVSPWQFLLDYSYCFASIPLGALMSKLSKNLRISILLFSITALIVNFICSTLSGMFFFSSGSPWSHAVIIFSLTYNATFIIPSYTISLVLIFVFFRVFKIFIQKRDGYR